MILLSVPAQRSLASIGGAVGTVYYGLRDEQCTDPTKRSEAVARPRSIHEPHESHMRMSGPRATAQAMAHRMPDW